MRVVIIGSKKGESAEAKKLGELLAKVGIAVFTGGGKGLPHEVAEACNKAGGTTVAISPALNREELLAKGWSDEAFTETRYIYPCFESFDWDMRLKLRNVLLMREAEAVVIVAGGTGTLTEYGISQMFGTPILVLRGSGGFADFVHKVEEDLEVKVKVRYFDSVRELAERITNMVVARINA